MVPHPIDKPPTFTNGQRVRYVGITGRANGPVGRVVRQHKSGVRVRWDDGRTDTVHPDDIAALCALCGAAAATAVVVLHGCSSEPLCKSCLSQWESAAHVNQCVADARCSQCGRQFPDLADAYKVVPL